VVKNHIQSTGGFGYWTIRKSCGGVDGTTACLAPECLGDQLPIDLVLSFEVEGCENFFYYIGFVHSVATFNLFIQLDKL
jgi:hypothetical protein